MRMGCGVARGVGTYSVVGLQRLENWRISVLLAKEIVDGGSNLGKLRSADAQDRFVEGGR